MQQFTAQDVRDAYVRIGNFVRCTPLEDSIYLSNDERRYRFKLESQQLGRSFKIRGALNVLAQLPRDQIERGVGTISTGNHGIAVSYAAKLLGIENCVVIVPFGTPRPKLDRIRFYGARVMTMGNNHDEALTLGLNYIDRHELFYVDPGDMDARVYAGQGTVGYELMVLDNQSNNITVFTPTAYGALIYKATEEYLKGYYEQSAETWQEVLTWNGNYDLAYIGIGRAQLRADEYKEAMKNFKISKDSKNYAEAFRLYRMEWVKSNAGWIFAIVAAALVLPPVIKRVRKVIKDVNSL